MEGTPQSGMAAPGMDPPPPRLWKPTSRSPGKRGGHRRPFAPLPGHLRGLTAASRHLPGGHRALTPAPRPRGPCHPPGRGTLGVPAHPPGWWHMGVPPAITGAGGETPTPPGPLGHFPENHDPSPVTHRGGQRDPSSTTGDGEHTGVLRGVTGRGTASPLRRPPGTWHQDRPPPPLPVHRSLTEGGGNREPPHPLSPSPASLPTPGPPRATHPLHEELPPLTSLHIPTAACSLSVACVSCPE